MTAARHDTIRTLLVEDTPLSAEIAKGVLEQKASPRFDYVHVETLSDALKALREDPSFEVVLLDLGLPDSNGLVTLDAVRVAEPEIAIIVVTALEFDEMALAAIRRGSDDYLYKGEFDRAVLERSVSHSIERRRMLNELERTHQQRNLARELRQLTRIVAFRNTPTRAGGTDASLRELDPESFATLSRRYEELALDMVEGRDELDDGGQSSYARLLWALAGELGSRRATPGDVVDLHCVALGGRVRREDPDTARAYIEEGRRLLLDLIGALGLSYTAPAA